MHLAFYKGNGGIFSRLIRRRTNGIYSHVEIVFSNGECFSSHEKDGGTRFAKFDLLPQDWDLVKLPDWIDESKVRAWCENEKGKPYDWRAIVRFTFGIKMFNNDNWFCSEICCAAFQPQGLFSKLDPSATSPQDLWIAAISIANAH